MKQALVIDSGVRFHFGSPVEKIEAHGKYVTGILSKGKFIKGDVIVSGTDAHFTHKHLLQDVQLPASVHIYRSCEIVRPDAPEGMENRLVMVMAPCDSVRVNDEVIERIRKNTLRKLSRILGSDIEKRIVFEYHLSPKLFEQRTYSYQGALYGISANSLFPFSKGIPIFPVRIKICILWEEAHIREEEFRFVCILPK